MFDGLGKSKFYTKCKSGVRLLKTRLEFVKKKRIVMQNFFRSDILDLLKNGLDVNAYGRAEGLLAEINMSICYDFIDGFCEHISSNLQVMGKERACPEDCKEAVSSLIYAAARFADLPELRELRTVFTGRYGNSLDSYVNKEFVEKLKSTSPTMEMKFRLMEGIAKEADISWNREVTEEKLYNPGKYNLRSPKQAENSEPDPGERVPFKEVQTDNHKALSYSSIPPPYTKAKGRDGSGPVQAINRANRPQSWDVSDSFSLDEPSETKKGHVRAASLDINGPVHPKLPDYDDFVARLASLRAGK